MGVGFHAFLFGPLDRFRQHLFGIGLLILLQMPVNKGEVTGFPQLNHVEDIQRQMPVTGPC